MFTVILARHGQDQDNRDKLLNGHRNTSLTEHGFGQAIELANELKDFKIDRVYCSPLLRAIQTAQTVTEVLHLKQITIDVRLIERNFGSLTGKPISQISELSDSILHVQGITYFLSGQNVESFNEVYHRARAFVKEMVEDHRCKNVLIVSHGDMSQMLMAVINHISWRDALYLPHLKNGHFKKMYIEADTLDTFNSTEVVEENLISCQVLSRYTEPETHHDAS
jgi:probable phosphoglycerate mutase